MDAGLLFQIFILIDVFAAGAILAFAALQIYSHMRPQHQVGLPLITPQRDVLPPMVKERMIQESQVSFQAALSKSAAGLEHDLGSTAELLDKLVKRLGAEIVGDELERYRTELSALRQQAQKDMGSVKEQLGAQRAELEQALVQEFAEEKKRLIAQIDTKLADAVVSFLIETMQHNIDLGAQEPYLKALLEEHKAEFRKEVDDESPAA